MFLKQKQCKTILCPPLSRSNWCGLDKSVRCDGLEKVRYITLLFLSEKHILTRRLGTSWEPAHERDAITWLTGTISSSCICLCWHHFWHIWKKEHNVCTLLKSSTNQSTFGFFEDDITRVMTCLVFKIFYF